MKHPSHDDLAAYALGALTEREQASVDRHLERCDACATEVGERYTPAVAVLAESVEQVEPPAELRQSLMATVHAEARESDAATAPPPRRRSRRSLLLRPVTGLAAIALIAAGLAGYLIAENGGSDEAETVPIAEAPGAISGDLVVEDGSATLRMRGMPELEKGSVYQVWVSRPSGMEPSATFLPLDDGTATASLPGSADDLTEVTVTAEPGPGRTTPTLPAIFGVRLN